MDPNEYLQPNFNPAKSKVAELRNVLLQNDVVYGAGARKQDLVDLFNEHVKPHAAEKLKELNNVVATEARIEVVKPRTASPVRKSPRKVSSSTDRNKRAVSADLGKIPDLSAAASRTRERSPSRRSPEFEERITRSPRRVGSSKQDTLKKQRSPRKVSSSKTEKIDTKVQAEDEDEGSDVAPVSKEEFEAARPPFKVDTKIESSFSNDNVFQSPTPSSPEFKTNKSIPRKRGSTESPEKTTRKATKPRKKTAFSSSPIAEPMTKSPAKSSLKISKFEDDDESFSEKFAGSSHFPNEADRTVQDVTQIDLEQKYGTPQENYTSHVNIASSPGTPAKTPSKSPYAKASSAIRDSLTSWLNTTPSKHEPALERDAEDPELVENERESISEDADVEDTTVDVLETLQKDIEDTINVVIKESEEAAKQINELFDAEDVVDEDTAPRESLIKWYAVLRFFQQLLTFTILAAIVTAGLWYREQRVLVGYCGNEIYQPLFPHTENIYLEELDNLLQEYKPQCIECPEHAICLPGLKIKCKQDFLVKGPWYKLYDVLPFPDYCVKDQEKENIISEVVAKSLELLRTRNAAVRCGDGDDFEVGISDEELYQFFYNSKRSSVSDEEFSEIWSDVLEDLAREPEINLRYRDIDGTRLTSDFVSSDEAEEEKNLPSRKQIVFRSTSGAKLSISCKFKKEIYERLEANKYLMIGSAAGFIALVIAYAKFQNHQERQSKVREISGVIITRLQKQQKNSINDPTGLTNRYLSTIQLRDELLTKVKGDRFGLWASILSLLEKNANIRSSSKEIHGDIVRVLEWIGE